VSSIERIMLAGMRREAVGDDDLANELHESGERLVRGALTELEREGWRVGKDSEGYPVGTRFVVAEFDPSVSREVVDALCNLVWSQVEAAVPGDAQVSVWHSTPPLVPRRVE
jgi:hypothetical protein